MNAAPTPAVSPQLTEPWTRFAAWAADELGLRVVRDGDLYRAEPDAHPAEGADQASTRKSWLRRRPKPEPTEDPPEPITAHSPEELVEALLARCAEAELLPHVRPVEQPTAVSEITDRLFGAYKLDGGRAHVAGCSLADVPFVRLSWVLPGRPAGEEQVAHAYYDERGRMVDPELARDLGLETVESYGRGAPKLAADILSDLIGSARSEFAASSAQASQASESLLSLVWVKRASGRLMYEFGDASTEALFEGWAATLQAPPVACPQTGRETFHLAMFEGGGIAAAEEIVASDVTGLRRLRQDLLTCIVTGKRGEAEWFGRSGFSDAAVLSDHLIECPRCGVAVAESELSESGCACCEQPLRPLSSDAGLDEVFRNHPELSGRAWRVSESPGYYVLLESTWFRRRVATIDKTTGALLRTAERGRFSSVWRVTHRVAPTNETHR